MAGPYVAAADLLPALKGSTPGQRSEMVGGINVTNLRGLRRWRAAYALADQVPAKIWCAGDSIWWGVGSDNTAGSATEEQADALGWPGRARQRFANEFNTPPAGILQTSPYIAEGNTGYDTRIVGLGKTTPTSFGLMGGRSITSISNGGAAGTWSFALPSCTAFEITYWDGDVASSQGGGFSYAVDGGGSTVVTKTGTNTYKTVRVSGLAQATHTLVITATETIAAQINHVTYDSGKGVVVGRFGKPGWTIRDMIGDGTNSTVIAASGKTRWQTGLTCGAPSMVVIGFGHNDCMQQLTAGQLTTAAYHKTTLQAQVDAIVAAGSCVLLVSSPWPQNTAAPGPDDFDAYWKVRDEIAAATDHCAHTKVADLWGTAAQANADAALRLQIPNSVHPEKRGYGDIGAFVYRLATSRDLAA